MFRSGRLILKRRTEHTLKPESPMVGVIRTDVELGLDEKGQGKYQKSEKVAGLVYLVLPLAARQTWEVRFRKQEEPRK